MSLKKGWIDEMLCATCEYRRCKHCNVYKKASQITNADKIRSMTDEELADFLDKCEGKGYQDSSITPINEDGYHMDMLDWLKQPAKED